MLLPLLVFAPMAMAPLVWALGRRRERLRTALVTLTCAASFCGCLALWRGETAFDWAGFCGLGLHLRADGFRSLYATVAAFMWLVSDVFAPQYFHHDAQRNRYWLFNLWTLGATLGVFLSDDLYTTLIFFEIMSLTSYTWVAQEETPAAMRAAQTYLAVAIIGGLTTLMGLFLLWHEFGTLSFAGLRAAMAGQTASPTVTAATWLTLFGFAAKAGLFPLHIWLPKAHPVAPAPASALLSGILTKSGIFGMVVLCSCLMPGNTAFGNALLVLGAITMLLGALLALFSVDLKRTLASSSVSQIGFITVGLATMTLLGEDGSLAAYGTLLHMVNHSLIKLCLFLCAGVVYMNLHRLNLNDICGFGRRKPLLHVCFLLGALSIGCIPPIGSGFNSKSLLHEGLLEYMEVLAETGGTVWPYKLLEILFIFSGGLTIAYMVKLYVCLFWEKNADPATQDRFDGMAHYMGRPAAAALLCASALLPFLGLFGEQLMSPLAARSMAFFGQEVRGPIHYFSGENLLGAAESAAVGALVYLLVVRLLLMVKEGTATRYVNRWPAWLDLEDRVYRPLLGGLATACGAVVGFVARIPDSKPLRVWLPKGVTAVTQAVASLPDSKLVLRWIPTGVTALTRYVGELPERVSLLLRSVLRAVKQRKPVPVGNRLTYYGGQAANRVAQRVNSTPGRHRRRLRTDYEYVLDEKRQQLEETGHLVGRSMTFGLILLAAGLLAMCVYLILESR